MHSTLPDNHSLPIVLQYQERASTEILPQSQKGNRPTAASSKTRLKSDDPLRCDICGRGGYTVTQSRGVRRHIRDKHEDSFCPHCRGFRGFKWHRSDEYKKHLEEQHPDVDLHAALTEARNYRRWETITKKRTQGQAFPSAIGSDQWCLGVRSPEPLTPPLPPALELALFDRVLFS